MRDKRLQFVLPRADGNPESFGAEPIVFPRVRLLDAKKS